MAATFHMRAEKPEAQRQTSPGLSVAIAAVVCLMLGLFVWLTSQTTRQIDDMNRFLADKLPVYLASSFLPKKTSTDVSSDETATGKLAADSAKSMNDVAEKKVATSKIKTSATEASQTQGRLQVLKGQHKEQVAASTLSDSSADIVNGEDVQSGVLNPPELIIDVYREWQDLPRLDINNASAELIAATLPGISPDLANLIVHSRMEQLFESLDGLGDIGVEHADLLEPFVFFGGQEPEVRQVGFEEVDAQHAGDPALVINKSIHSNSLRGKTELLFDDDELVGSKAVAIEFVDFYTPAGEFVSLIDADGEVVARYGGLLGTFRSRAVVGDLLTIQWSSERPEIQFDVRSIIGYKSTQ